MKNRLLATLLVFTAIPFVASSLVKATGNKQPSKIELLAHLKNVKTEIQEELADVTFEEEILQDHWGKEDYLFISNLIQDIYAVLPLSNLLFGKNTDIAQLYFEKACEMKQPNEIKNEIDLETLIYTNIENKEDIEAKNEIKLILFPIFIKHHKAYCPQYPSGKWYNLCFEDLFSDLDIVRIFILQPSKQILNDLLQKIETKTKDLEI